MLEFDVFRLVRNCIPYFLSNRYGHIVECSGFTLDSFLEIRLFKRHYWVLNPHVSTTS